jgi:hypothetical protein
VLLERARLAMEEEEEQPNCMRGCRFATVESACGGGWLCCCLLRLAYLITRDLHLISI